ncbi:MAG: hypothetical protein OXE17_11150 [Chloroflexi bacterium]|nr:hypothetical protein [Chloroflexota bacterium]
MAWQDELMALRGEVETALTRILGEPVEEDADVIRDRAELYQLAASLQIAQMLLDMNEIVLSGTGRVESTSLMEYYDEDENSFQMEDLRDGGEQEEEEDEEEDVEEELRLTLFWEDSTECAVDVELGKSDGRIYLLVNGEEVRQQREVLETAVLDAFRKEMNLLAS